MGGETAISSSGDFHKPSLHVRPGTRALLSTTAGDPKLSEIFIGSGVSGLLQAPSIRAVKFPLRYPEHA